MNTPEAVDSPEAIAEDQRRIRRKAMWLFFWASPVLFFILFYGVENWRGARAWKKCQEEMAAKGEKLDYASFIPPEIPDAQNFAAAPVFQKVFDEPGDKWSGKVPRPSVAFDITGVEMPRANWMVGDRTSLSVWQEFYSTSLTLKDLAAGTNAAEAVLRVLGQFDPVLDEIRQYSARPLSRYPVKYNIHNPMLTAIPHASFSKAVVQVLGLRSRAGLELGRVDQAADDVNLMLRTAESIKGEPMLISSLVRIAIMDITERAIWEGMQEHHWTGAQLQRWQRSFSQRDHASEMLDAMRAERAEANSTLLTIYANPGSIGLASKKRTVRRGQRVVSC